MLLITIRRQKEYPYTYRSVKRRGKKDGRSWQWQFWPFKKPSVSIPPSDQEEPAQFEQTLVESAEGSLGILAHDWQKQDEKLKKAYCKAQKEVEQARNKLEKEEPEAKEAREHLAGIRQQFLNLPMPELGLFWMIFWLLVIGVGEFFFNAVVFQIFGQTKFETYITALVIGVAVPLLGHGLGRLLKREHKKRIDKILIGLIPIVVLTGLYAVAQLRGLFLEALDLERLFGVSITQDQTLLIFFSFNILLLFVSMFIGYEGGHLDPERYRRIRKQYKHALDSYKKESAEARSAAGRLEKAEMALIHARQDRQNQFETIKEEAKYIKETNDWYISLYRSENISARDDEVVPTCFKTPPQGTKIPDILCSESLDWSCEETVTIKETP